MIGNAEVVENPKTWTLETHGDHPSNGLAVE